MILGLLGTVVHRSNVIQEIVQFNIHSPSTMRLINHELWIYNIATILEIKYHEQWSSMILGLLGTMVHRSKVI